MEREREMAGSYKQTNQTDPDPQMPSLPFPNPKQPCYEGKGKKKKTTKPPYVLNLCLLYFKGILQIKFYIFFFFLSTFLDLEEINLSWVLQFEETYCKLYWQYFIF